jgi:hypothetical protein
VGRSGAAWAGLVLVWSGCGLGAAPADYGDPTAGWQVQDAIRLELLDPAPWSTPAAAQLDATIAAEHASGIARVELQLGAGPWEQALEQAAAAGTWTAPLALRFGPNDLRLRATAGDGRRRVVDVVLHYAGAAPVIVVESPVNGGYAGLEVAVAGRAAAAQGATITAVDVQLDDGPWTAADLDPDGAFRATLPGNAAPTPVLRARATDSGGGVAVTHKQLFADPSPPRPRP